jgi:hypothetical protein
MHPVQPQIAYQSSTSPPDHYRPQTKHIFHFSHKLLNFASLKLDHFASCP